jgi:hypothetical protein
MKTTYVKHFRTLIRPINQESPLNLVLYEKIQDSSKYLEKDVLTKKDL